MNTASSLRHSSRGVTTLCWFALSVAATSAVLAWAVHRWVPLPWWRVFRRCVSVSSALMLVVFMWRVHRQSIRALGLGGLREGKWQVLRGLLLGFGALLLIGGVYVGLNVCRLGMQAEPRYVWAVLLAFLPAALMIGVLEELIFRGYLFQQLLAYSKPLAVLGTSLLYAMVHLKPHPQWPASAMELIGLFLLGVVLAVSVLRTGQLYLAIGLHASLAYGARVNKLVVQFLEPSLPWFVGTNRLVNGVVAWVVLIGIGWLVIRRTRQAV